MTTTFDHKHLTRLENATILMALRNSRTLVVPGGWDRLAEGTDRLMAGQAHRSRLSRPGEGPIFWRLSPISAFLSMSVHL